MWCVRPKSPPRPWQPTRDGTRTGVTDGRRSRSSTRPRTSPRRRRPWLASSSSASQTSTWMVRLRNCCASRFLPPHRRRVVIRLPAPGAALYPEEHLVHAARAKRVLADGSAAEGTAFLTPETLFFARDEVRGRERSSSRASTSRGSACCWAAHQPVTTGRDSLSQPPLLCPRAPAVGGRGTHPARQRGKRHARWRSGVGRGLQGCAAGAGFRRVQGAPRLPTHWRQRGARGCQRRVFPAMKPTPLSSLAGRRASSARAFCSAPCRLPCVCHVASAASVR